MKDAALITAYGGIVVMLFVSFLNYLLQRQNTRMTREVKANTETVIEKVGEVHEQTNSRMSRIEEELRLVRAENRRLGEAAGIAEKTRVELAHEEAQRVSERERAKE